MSGYSNFPVHPSEPSLDQYSTEREHMDALMGLDVLTCLGCLMVWVTPKA
jgi:hypothetical protein